MDRADRAALAPSVRVLEAFDADGRPERMAEGAHPTWRVGDVVLKPADISDEQLRWQSDLYERLGDHHGFRLSRMVLARDGQLLVDGWYAMTYLPGRHDPGRWLDIIAVGDVFHAAVADEPAPAFLERRDDPWAIGDRVAWGGLSRSDVPKTKHLDRLLSLLRPIADQPQLIHGDLTGNVLFDEDLPPAILDLSPYHRPKRFASAVVVADALVWEGADQTLLRAFDDDPAFPQYLLRALIYRTVTDRLFRLDEPLRTDDDDPYATPVELAASLAAG